MSFFSVLGNWVSGSFDTQGGGRPDAFQTILEHSADVICHIENERFVHISLSAERLLGWDPGALIGTNPLEGVCAEDRPTIQEVISHLFSGEKNIAIAQCRVVCGDGSLRWCETTTRLELTDSGSHRAVIIIRDISDRKRLEEELAAQALQDGLTGLANRRAFDQALDREWKRTLRDGGEIALLLLDVDYFKQFNDTYGHQAGDDSLRAVAACVRTHCRRPGDLACRYGGEEIAVILGASGTEGALAIADAIRSSVEALAIPHETSVCANKLTVSVGVATALAREGGSIRMPEGLLQAADHALYKAKAAGRNRVVQSVLIAPLGS
ncbi:diguanylate cyclase (GGDEF)-like protein/PAS domain S-box-containing protein [Sphingobium xenophagum]|uniref:diguanylate cyclase n=1 Tax=Sphingobium xenophagum TaxID=121428 RepID=A0ABU1X627_SPHXE|nr:sensor domain-containing diguanylate cyclase [Sphingobium xenophagum]MDR7157038.1 diguanylate cyclase (GGDEF)-like protein/PAS domain S-box-containing protein [Sphingobium xenophagum]